LIDNWSRGTSPPALLGPASEGTSDIRQGGVGRLVLEEQAAVSCTLVYQQLTVTDDVGACFL